MKFYKFLIIFFMLVSFFYINLTDIQSISKYNQPIKIKIITPTKSQDYIISKPTIKASFYSKFKIDLNSIKLYLNNEDVTKNAKINKNNIEYTPNKKLKRGTQIVKIVVCDKEHNKSTVEWYFNVGTPIYKIFKGNFIDSENINEQNSIENILKNNNDFKFSDFFVINNSIFNSKKIDNDFKNIFKKYSNNDFVLLNALKIKLNTLNSQFVLYDEKENSNYSNLSNLSTQNLYKNLFYKDEILCSFNPISNNLNFFNYMKYSSYGDNVFSLIDITDRANNTMSPFYLKIYNTALDNGWHISPITNQYTTSILCTNLSKDSILNSLKNRRTYVSNNTNLNLEFTINGSSMGAIIKNPSKLDFNISSIDLNSKNKIKNIYVISNNNKIIKNIKLNNYLAKYEFTLKEFEKYSYYYLIIKQDNNKITITSPIWVEN